MSDTGPSPNTSLQPFDFAQDRLPRSSASPPRSPLSSQTLGGYLKGSLILAWLAGVGCATSGDAAPPQGVPVTGEAAAAAAGCKNAKPPVALSQPQPKYPASLRRAGMTGKVRSQAVIEVDGSITGVKLLDSTDNELTKLVYEAVRQWKYQPGSCDGVPTKMYMTTVVSFDIP